LPPAGGRDERERSDVTIARLLLFRGNAALTGPLPDLSSWDSLIRRPESAPQAGRNGLSSGRALLLLC